MSNMLCEPEPSVDARLKLLHSVALFAGLTEGAFEALAELATEKRYPKGAIIISEGDDAQSVYIVASGKVKIYLVSETGRELVLEQCGPGEYFGEIALLDDAPRSASVTVLEPCELLAVSRQAFQSLVASRPELAEGVIEQLAQRVRVLTNRVRSFALGDAYGRLVATLMSLAKPQDGVWVIEEQITHYELANMVGASREMVSRVFRDLRTGGYVTVENRQITILRKLPRSW